ncbi:MAG: beta-ketoacyl synthase N-terminal-like domain-containing protein [Planctomycetia bacterium]|nr:beta-ketoacyl synthase N-terminal-like domain-containing protein [Planctomycetia bacterium]
MKEPIAIVGMACRLPGAENVEAFWEMLLRGKSALGKVPPERLDRELFYDPQVGVRNKTYTDLAGCMEYPSVEEIREWLPPNAEKEYDKVPLCVAGTVLQACWDAGWNPRAFPIRNTGVYMGTTRSGEKSQELGIQLAMPQLMKEFHAMPEVERLLDEPQRKEITRAVSERMKNGRTQREEGFYPFYLSSDLTRLIVQMLGLDGPQMVFNSACASSLHSVAQAMMALQTGSIDAAIAGGASYFHSDTLVLFASSRSMSSRRSCPFDEEADGLIVGEGNVIFLLRRLEDALRNGEDVKAVLTGVGMASDGKGKSLWAPRKEGQAEAICRAWEGLNRAEVDAIEGHATSTALGDATELETVQEVFGEALRGRKIPIGSTKGNIGHTLECAGAAGILKAVLTLRHEIIPPVAGLKKKNSRVAWDTHPCEVLTEARAWPRFPDRPRRIGVNSFGIGGLNAHLVVEEFRPEFWRKKRTVQEKPSTLEKTIAVVGCGCIYPHAHSLAAFREWLKQEGSGFMPIPERYFDLAAILSETAQKTGYPPTQPWGAIMDGYVYDWRKNKVPPKQVENASPIQFMMLDAVNEALEQSRYTFTPEQRRRTGVVVGTGFGGLFADQMNLILWIPVLEKYLREELRKKGVSTEMAEKILRRYADTLHRKMPALLDETGSFTPSALASRITKTLDLHGGAVAVDAGSASFGAALECAMDQLLTGMNDTMICVCGQQDFSPLGIEYQMICGEWSQNPEISPFDNQSNGFLPGEGCGVVVLRRYDVAREQENPIQAVLTGWGMGSGGSPLENLQSAMARSLGKEPDFPKFVQAPFHGVASRDAILAEGVARVGKKYRNEKITLGTVSHRIGYQRFTSGMPEMLAAILQLQEETWNRSSFLQNPAVYFQRWENLSLPLEELSMKKTDRVMVCGGETSCYAVQLKRK